MAILNSTDIATAQAIINNTQKGDYELKEIYGSAWKTITNPTTFGKDFKETVDNGHLQNIQFKELKTNNHHVYEIN